VEGFENHTGHDAKFLGEEYQVPHPKLRSDLEKDMAETIEGDKILNYAHFSIVVSKSRRMAIYTVVDIDGAQLVEDDRRVKWRYDPRIEHKYQIGEELYHQNKLDKGHLVRRKDPMWGSDYEAAGEDTFYYTNCSPQHESFNQKSNLWLGLEDYLLNNIKNNAHKAIIFTGPVLKEDDVVYRNVKIPEEYWKIAVVLKEDGDISATAYIVSQKDFLKELENDIPGEFRTFQVKVSVVDALNGLDFSDLRKHDPFERVESKTFGVKIEHFEEIQL
jgi:endonuclease G